MTSPVSLTNGEEYLWRVMGQNAFGSSWSTALRFEVNTTACPTQYTGAPAISAPVSPTIDQTPTFTWSHVDAMWYLLLVQEKTTSETLINQWIFGASACVQGGACTLDSLVTLPLGEYKSWVMAWNASDEKTWSSRYLFEVSSGKSQPLSLGTTNISPVTPQMSRSEGSAATASETAPSAVPEPSTLVLFGIGLVGLLDGFLKRKKR